MVIGDPSRAVATIDLAAIAQNYQRIANAAPMVMAVVKADAYGHGVDTVAPFLRSLDAPWLGVALPSEALDLRAHGDRGRVLAWLWAPGDPTIVECVAADVDLSVSDEWALAQVAESARAARHRARIHLKVDTGLGRNGSSVDSWPALLEAAKMASDHGLVEIVGIWSHLGSADSPEDPRTTQQLHAFESALDVAAALGIDPEIRHVANSAGAISRADVSFDLVRSGIALYGLTPGVELGSARDLGLTPAMTVTAHLAHVKPLAADAPVSYGRTWQAAIDTVVGLVPVGYADGIPRAVSNVVDVLVGERRCPVVGRVAMDQFVVDLGPDSRDRPGDAVLCFGPGDHGEPTADDWATASGTIGYEIVTRLGERIPRRYVGGH